VSDINLGETGDINAIRHRDISNSNAKEQLFVYLARVKHLFFLWHWVYLFVIAASRVSLQADKLFETSKFKFQAKKCSFIFLAAVMTIFLLILPSGIS